MALKPKDLKLSVDELKIVAQLEVLIDAKLEEMFMPGWSEYKVLIGGFPTPRIVAAVKLRYIQGKDGWSSVTQSGDFLIFKV